MKINLPSALSAYFAGIAVQPIGHRADGRPIYPIAGGAEDDNPDDDSKDKGADKPDFQPIASQADLDRIVGERLARERAKYADYPDLKAKADAADAAAAAAMTEHEKAVAAARKEGETEAMKAVNSRLVAVEARALAAQAGFRSLSDVSLVDLKDVTVGDDGKVDVDAIKAKLKELSDAEPWRLDDGKKPTPKPDKTQGRDKTERTATVAAGRDLYAERRGGKKTA